MESDEDILANLDVIQKNISSTNSSADIASVDYVCKNIEACCNSEKDTKIMVKSLNILHDSILLITPLNKDEGYVQSVIRGILKCICVSDLYRMVDSVVLELSEDKSLLDLILHEINSIVKSLIDISDEVRSRYESLLRKIMKKSTVESTADFDIGGLNETSLSLNESPRTQNDLLMIKSLPSKNDSSSQGFSPRLLNISFIPQSLTEQWVLAKSAEEVSMVLDGIILMYGSLNDQEKKGVAQDVSKLIKQILATLRFDTTPVIVNSLKLLEALATDHSKEFIPDLGAIFPRIQRYMDDAKVAIRHHSLKLGGALVVRLPFDVVGRFVFAVIEYKPAHPEIAMKLAALSLLRISPSYSMSSNPLLSRIMLIAGDYMDSSSKAFESPRGNSAAEVAKDTIALALMTLCYSTQIFQRDDSSRNDDGNNVENMLPIKLSTVLGIPPQSPLSAELCRRARASDFPSLRQDAYVAGLATIAMEASLENQKSSSDSLSGKNEFSPEPYKSKRSKMSIKIPDFSVTPIKSVAKSVNGAVEHKSIDNSCARQLYLRPDNGVSVLHNDNDDGMTSCAPTMESYQPSWTPKEMGTPLEGSSPWALPYNIPSSPITTPLDRSKLKAIKKGGRKPGSRLRARTADEALLQDDVSVTNELAKMPATAGNDSIGRLKADKECDGIPVTPMQVGVYSKECRGAGFDDKQHQIQNIKVTGRRASRSVVGNSLEKEYFSGRNLKKMETLEFSSESDDEESKPIRNNKIHKGIAARKNVKDPFTSGSRGVCRSDEEEEPSSMKEIGAEPEVKTFQALRKKSQASVNDNFSVQGSSLQRQNSSSTHSSENIPEANLIVGGQSGIDCSDTSESYSSSRIGKKTVGTGLPASRSIGRGPKVSNVLSEDNGENANINGNEHIMVVVDKHEQSSGQDAFDYLERDQLEPCVKPNREISKAVKELTTADWPDIFHLLNTTRKLMIHHSADVLNSGHLHAIALGLVKQVQNLRSAVAKNSILAIDDMFFGLRHKADGEITTVIAALIKRCADSSLFITDSIDECIVTIIRNTTACRTLGALVTGLDNRSQNIRGKVSGYIAELVLSMSDQLHGSSKEIDILLSKLVKSTQDSSPEARMNSREIVRLMITNGLISRKQMEAMLSPDLVQKSMTPQASPKVSTLTSPLHRSKRFGTTRRESPRCMTRKDVPSLNTRKLSNGSRHGDESGEQNSIPSNSIGQLPIGGGDNNLVVAGISPRGNMNEDEATHNFSCREKGNASTKMSRNAQESFPELVELPILLLALSSKSWQERRDAVSRLSDHIMDNFELLSKANRIEHSIERVLEMFEDGSVKVVQHAIACVSKIHIAHSSLLPSIVLTSLPAVLNVSSSANKQINAQGSQLLKMLLKGAPSAIAPQQLVNLALHDKDRIKAAALRAMCIYMNIMNNNELENEFVADNERYRIMKSLLFTAAVKTLCQSSAKPEVRTAAADVLRVIQENVEEYIDEWVDHPMQQNEIKRILR